MPERIARAVLGEHAENDHSPAQSDAQPDTKALFPVLEPYFPILV